MWLAKWFVLSVVLYALYWLIIRHPHDRDKRHERDA